MMRQFYLFSQFRQLAVISICDALRNLVCHLHNLKKREKHSVKLQALAKISNPLWLFFTFLKLYMTVPNRAEHLI